MTYLWIITIVAISLATANLVYCVVSIRADLGRGRRGLAGLGIIASVVPIFIIGWYVWAIPLLLSYSRH